MTVYHPQDKFTVLSAKQLYRFTLPNIPISGQNLTIPSLNITIKLPNWFSTTNLYISVGVFPSFQILICVRSIHCGWAPYLLNQEDSKRILASSILESL